MHGYLPYILIALGSALWGIIGIFVQALASYGFSPLEIVTIRVVFAGLILIIYSLFKDRKLLKIKLMDIKYFIGTGLLSIVFFNWSYFTTMQQSSISVAVVLLYTGPAFVTLIARFVFKEKLTNIKILALFLMIIGNALVVGFLPVLKISITYTTLLIGLGSGLGYALYSIFGKLASAKYSSITITTYTFIIASIALIPTTRLWEKTGLFTDSIVLVHSISLGLFPSALAYIFYTIGLSHIETGRAAIMTNIEPVVALLVGFALFNEILTFWQISGSVLVLVAAVMVQKKVVK